MHFACTSEDINNLSIARCVKNGVEQVWPPVAQAIVDHLAQKADAYRDKAMLSLTHGQPATPTTLGKELAVLRVPSEPSAQAQVEGPGIPGQDQRRDRRRSVRTLAACPDVDWVAVSREFVTNRMGLTWNPLTTQIESARLAGRAVRHRLPRQPHPAQPVRGRVDVHLPRRVRAGAGQGRDRFLHHAAQGQPDSFRERRSQLWRSAARCWTPCRRRRWNRVGSAI